MSAHDELVFGLAARLGCFAHQVEALSAREVAGWLKHFRREAAREAAAAEGAVDLAELTPEQRRALFHR
jgi:hypothetical protein